MHHSNSPEPPEYLLRIFRWFCHPDLVEDIEGDLHERFHTYASEFGYNSAKKRLLIEIIFLAQPGLIKRFLTFTSFISLPMIKHFFRISIRYHFRQKRFTLLNLLGLMIGFTSAMYLFLYTQEERNYDQFHQNFDRIYRVLEHFKNGDTYTTTSLSPYQFSELLAKQYPEIESFIRVDGTIDTRLVEYGDKQFKESKIALVDSNFFDFFSFPLISGKAQTVLLEPNTTVITETIAKKYFGSEDPIGKTLTFNNTFDNTSFDVKVTGITRIPTNSHFHKDFFISMPTGDTLFPGKLNNWGWTSQYAYLLLKEHVNPETLSLSSEQIVKDHAPQWFQDQVYFTFQPLEKVHLHSSEIKDEMEIQGDIQYINILTVCGLSIRASKSSLIEALKYE